MSDNILETIRKMIGAGIDKEFDDDLIVHINSALGTLAQVGACPKGSAITDGSESWQDLFQDSQIAAKAKTYIYYKVRLGFDPPQSSFAAESIKTMAEEELWRINSDAEYDGDDNE